MKGLFVTLAVGAEYFDNAVECYTELGSKTTNFDFSITSNNTSINSPDIILNHFSLDRYNDTYAGFSFYLNLKVLALKYALDKGYDYVIYNDADWRTTPAFSQSKLLGVFEYMEKSNLDALFERPAEIGYHKRNFDNCFFQQKILDFNLLEHDLWDKGHCFNEQFMVFKVNWKFRVFVMKWEMMLWYSIANNIRHYPDGFDIGVAALEANLNYSYNSFNSLLPDCFTFKDKEGNIYSRF